MKKLIELVVTKKGLPALWEFGGAEAVTGFAQIIAGPNGERKYPVFERNRAYHGEPLACGNHMLFVVKPGDLIVRATQTKWDFSLVVLRIYEMFSDVTDEGDFRGVAVAILENYSLDGKTWKMGEPVQGIKTAANAARTKATQWHCREGIYYSPEYVSIAPPVLHDEIQETEEASSAS
jgi:hypothetical protein